MPRRAGDLRASWRRVKVWLIGDREHIAQEGLLAGRTLLLSPRPLRHDEVEGEAGDGAGPAAPRDDHR